MKTWRERIAEAEVLGMFTLEDNSAAESWLTCAVGEQRAAMPEVVKYRQIDGWPGELEPEDEGLRHLGGGCGEAGFFDAVDRHDFIAASRLLDAIEDRALQLKRETHRP